MGNKFRSSSLRNFLNLPVGLSVYPDFLPTLVPPSPSNCIASFENVWFEKNKEFLDALNDCQLLKEASKLFLYGDV
jgi:hypothetical protein